MKSVRTFRTFRFRQFLFGEIQEQILLGAVEKDDVAYFQQWWGGLDPKKYDTHKLINQKNARGLTLLDRAHSIPMAQALIKAGVEIEVSPQIQKAAKFYCGINQISVELVAKTVAYLNANAGMKKAEKKKALLYTYINDREQVLIKTWLSTQKEPNPILETTPQFGEPEGRSVLALAINNKAIDLIQLILKRLQEPEVDFKRQKNCDIIRYCIDAQHLIYHEGSTKNMVSMVIDFIQKPHILKSLKTDMEKHSFRNPWLEDCIKTTEKKIDTITIEKERQYLDSQLNKLAGSQSETLLTPTALPSTSIPSKKHKI